LQPLHVMYSYKSNDIFLINSYLKKFENLHVRADGYTADGKLVYSDSAILGVTEDGIARCFTMAAPNGVNDTWFLRLKLTDNRGKVQDINWYWLSTKRDELNWAMSRWYYTPQSNFADFSALEKLP